MSRRPVGLLMTESKRDFARLQKELNTEIGPMGVVERLYVDDLITVFWDILRFRRIKAEIINGALLQAAKNILEQVLHGEDFASYLDRERAAEALALSWIQSDEGKAEVAELLGRFQLDDTAIEAEACRLRAEDLERMDRMVALALARRDKVLHFIAEIRGTLANFLHQASDQIIEHDELPQLVKATKGGG